MAGPLSGVRVVEMVGIGPCPFAAMMLADMGAEVIRIDRKAKAGEDNPYPVLGTRHDVMARGRRSLALDLKKPAGRSAAMRLAEQADVLLEGFRPGVMERSSISNSRPGPSPEAVIGGAASCCVSCSGGTEAKTISR